MLVDFSPYSVREVKDGNTSYLRLFYKGEELPRQIEISIDDSINEAAVVQIKLHLGVNK